MGISEKDLYYETYEQYISRNKSLQHLDEEFKRYKYEKHEENRKNIIEDIKNMRNELKSKQEKTLQKSFSSEYILSRGESIINSQRARIHFSQKQQIDSYINYIEQEYKREDLQKKIEEKDKLTILREEEIKKMRKLEKIEHDQRDKVLLIKKEMREKRLKEELLKKVKQWEEEEKQNLLKNQMKKNAIERERKERINEQKIKEEEFRQRLAHLFLSQAKKRENFEKKILSKEEVQKRNLELIKKEKNEEFRKKSKITEQKIKNAQNIKNYLKFQSLEKDKLYLLQKSRNIEEQLSIQKEIEKKEMHERLVRSAIKREEVEENLKKVNRIYERRRLKIINEINEKDKAINRIKLQKLKILNQGKKLVRNYEENREKLLNKFNFLISQRRKKTKDELIDELLGYNKNNSSKIDNMNPKDDESMIKAYKNGNSIFVTHGFIDK